MKNKIKAFFNDLINLLRKKEMLILPGHLAFFFVLSVVPILTIIFFITASFNISSNAIMNFIETNFSKELVKFLIPIIHNNDFSFSTIIFLIVTFYLASNGCNSIILVSNTIFNINNANYIKRRIKALFLTLLMVLLFTFILIVPLFGNTIIKVTMLLGVKNELIQTFEHLYPILNVPISLLVVFIFIKLVYTIAPDESIPSKYVNKGTFFTTICWVIITLIYSYYINNLAHYNMYYGGLSSIIMLMIWLYFMAQIFVIGLAINYRKIEKNIEETNTRKLDEIQEKVLEITSKKAKTK